MDQRDLDKRFNAHGLNNRQAENCALIREKCSTLANIINTEVPDGREKSTAITKLEEVMFWANAGISREE
jgi:hypothetical protein